ncbi:MAG: mazG [Rhodospirillaceae bacterium]|nr:MAG: mazG [Rhodospirillaceae bacterium]
MSQDHGIERLLAIMARLRTPVGGCPWDIEQTFASIVPHTIEEAYEVADAIEKGDMILLKEELGDLLLQVVFYAQMAREQDLFAFADVAEAIADKLIRRHPHVFGEAKVDSAEAQLVVWEALKEDERRRHNTTPQQPSALDGIATALPALTRAGKLGQRAARVGFDWPTAAPVFDKIAEETAELRAALAERESLERVEEEMGDVLLACANLARTLKIDPETALRKANARFEHRFRRLESLLADEPSTDPETLDRLWRHVKANE